MNRSLIQSLADGASISWDNFRNQNGMFRGQSDLVAKASVRIGEVTDGTHWAEETFELAWTKPAESGLEKTILLLYWD